MQVLKRAVLVIFAWLACAQVATAHTPDQVAKETTEKVINLLMDKSGRYKANVDAFYDDMEKIIDPVIAFDDMARGVMGKYAHRSTKDEIAQFTAVFREGMLRFYSKAMLAFDTSELSLAKVDPASAEILKNYEAGKIRQVPVNLTIKSKGTSYAMSYDMVKKNGSWVARNFSVEGINIGLQFRTQFAEAMNKFNTVAKVITKWPEMMKVSEKSEASDPEKADRNKD